MAREKKRIKAEKTCVTVLRFMFVHNRNIDHTQLVDLPVEIPFAIVKKLPLPSFFSTNRVCRLFRSFLKSMMQSYLANLPPYVVATKTCGNETIYFYNIMNSERYHIRVVSYVTNFLRGISGDFLVFENIYRIRFSHPITGTTLDFYKPPPFSSNFCSSIILVENFSDKDYLVVVLHEGNISVNHFGNWSIHSLSLEGEAIQMIDLAASKYNVLALTHKGSIANMVYSNSLPSFELTMMLKERCFKENSKLVISVEEEPMVVEFDYSKSWFQIFRADLDLKEWVIVTNLGNQALFIEKTAVILCDMRCWEDYLTIYTTLTLHNSVGPFHRLVILLGNL